MRMIFVTYKSLVSIDGRRIQALEEIKGDRDCKRTERF